MLCLTLWLLLISSLLMALALKHYDCYFLCIFPTVLLPLFLYHLLVIFTLTHFCLCYGQPSSISLVHPLSKLVFSYHSYCSAKRVEEWHPCSLPSTHLSYCIQVIIYDFACQLAAYCFIHEAWYFQNICFLIDEVYAHNHTQCGKACKQLDVVWWRYMSNQHSTAKCGNKEMKIIQRSIGFMLHAYAVHVHKGFPWCLKL